MFTKAAGGAGLFTAEPDLDLSVFPDVMPLSTARPETEITLGDQHGNLIRNLYELIRNGVIECREKIITR